MIESTSGSDAEAEQWCLIESDPDVFTKLIREYGCKGVQVKELQSLEPEQFVDLRPVHGLFILFKWEPNQEPIGSSVLDAEADIIFFAQQDITNAFATQAILSILLNCKHNQYYNIFNNENDSVKNCICIGMHLDKKTLAVTIQHKIHDMIMQK